MGLVETAIGVVVGALVTILASRYYFRRSISKRLGIYRLLSSFVFDGIAPDVRAQLQFRFQDREVRELQQVIFLVANDGERAIRDVIEKPTLRIPADVEVLDASVIYRQPEALTVELLSNHVTEGTNVALDFPLLNKGEFFVVKLLLSGRFKLAELTVLCDDLPRCIRVEPLPANSLQDPEYKFEWVPAAMGLLCLPLAGWACYTAYLISQYRPSLFHPFVHRPGSLSVHLDSVLFLGPFAVIVILFLTIGLTLLALAIFGGEFPPRGRRFRLPRELQALVFPYRVLHFSPDFVPEPPIKAANDDDVDRK